MRLWATRSLPQQAGQILRVKKGGNAAEHLEKLEAEMWSAVPGLMAQGTPVVTFVDRVMATKAVNLVNDPLSIPRRHSPPRGIHRAGDSIEFWESFHKHRGELYWRASLRVLLCDVANLEHEQCSEHCLSLA